MRPTRLYKSLNNAPRKLALAAAVAMAASTPTALMAQNLVLEEIIVTATKKDEMLQDVASTVNVFTGDRLTNVNAFSFRDLESMTPGLSLVAVDPRSDAIMLRGISFNRDSRADPAVVTYWNGIAIGPLQSFQQMFDMSRVEVLRGPQGTLQGETSPAGSIQLYTARPNLDIVDGEIIQTISDNDGVNTQVAASLPIIEGVLGIRVAALYDAAEDGTKAPNASDGSRDTSAGRFSIGWRPTDALSLNLSYQYLENTANAYYNIRSFDDGAGSLAQNYNPQVDAYDRTSLAEGNSDLKTRNEMLTFEANYEFEAHQATYLFGYYDGGTQTVQDMDSANIIPNFQETRLVNTQEENSTHEFRFTNTEAEFWEYTAGLYYNTTVANTINTNTIDAFAYTGPGSPPVPAGPMVATGTTLIDIPITREVFGTFLDNKFYLTEDTTLGLGVRWKKLRAYTAVDVYAGEGFSNGLTGPLPEGFFLQGLIPAPQQSDTTIALTGGVKLSHNLNEEVMVYASYDRGHRNPGYAVAPEAPDLTVDELSFDEETSNAFELGFKSVLDNGRYQVNGAVFYQEFTDYISRADTVYYDDTPGNSGGGTTNNVMLGGLTYNGDAVIRGAELDVNAVITENWTAFIGASYTDGKFDGAEQPCGGFGEAITPGQNFNTCSTSGRIGAEPNWSVSATSEYTIPMGSFDGFVRGLYKFTDNRADDTTGTNVGGYGVMDLFIGIRDSEGAWEVSAWSKNLFDKDALSDFGGELNKNALIFNAPPTPPTVVPHGGYQTVTVIPERSFGITAKYKFGVF